jgi:hypothetical protein
VSASAIILTPDQQAVPANAVVGTPDQKLVPRLGFMSLKGYLQSILDEKARGREDYAISYLIGVYAKEGLEWMNQVE